MFKQYVGKSDTPLLACKANAWRFVKHGTDLLRHNDVNPTATLTITAPVR